MEKLSLGKVISSFDAERLSKCAEHLKKAVKGIEIDYYNSKLPFTRTLRRPTNPKKTDRKKTNHIEIKLHKKLVLEFYGSKIKASGNIYNERLTPAEYDKIIRELAKFHVFTFRSHKRYNHDIKYLMIFIAWFLIFLASMLIFMTSPVWSKALGLLISLFAVILMMLYAE